jgi:hypothetical protein
VFARLTKIDRFNAELGPSGHKILIHQNHGIGLPNSAPVVIKANSIPSKKLKNKKPLSICKTDKQPDNCPFCFSSLRTKARRTQRGYFSFVVLSTDFTDLTDSFVFYKNLFNLRHLLTIMEQVYLFFVANRDIKDAKKIDPFRIKTFVFFAPLRETLKNKRDSY